MLTDYQWADIWSKCLALWPEWEPVDEEQSIWREALDRYDVMIIDKARRQYFTECSRYKRPELVKLLAVVRGLWSAHRQSVVTDHHQTYYIGCVCVEEGKQQPGYYETYDLCSWTGPQFSDDEARLNEVQRIAQARQDRYGGKWVGIVTADYAEIRTKATQARSAIAPGQPTTTPVGTGTHETKNKPQHTSYELHRIQQAIEGPTNEAALKQSSLDDSAKQARYNPEGVHVPTGNQIPF